MNAQKLTQSISNWSCDSNAGQKLTTVCSRLTLVNFLGMKNHKPLSLRDQTKKYVILSVQSPT